jgi:hypothetical protein
MCWHIPLFTACSNKLPIVTYFFLTPLPPFAVLMDFRNNLAQKGLITFLDRTLCIHQHYSMS